MKHLKRLALLTVFFTLFTTVAHAASSMRIYVNGMRINQDVIVSNNYSYVPLRAISEALGADVYWDKASNSAYITFNEEDAIAKIVTDISPSVVTIVGNYQGTGAQYQYNNPTVHGSGVVYKSNGYIITNAHVVKNLKNLTVVLNNGEVLPGVVLYSDDDVDLAVVKIDKLGLRAVTFAEEKDLVSGKTAIAIGTPISLSMRNTVTKGIISGCDVAIEGSYYKLLQTDAAINPGNSGGPLVNSKGQLIGINSSKFSGVGVDNMGFAIPVDTVKYVLDQFEKYGEIKRPKLSFSMTQSWEADIGLPTSKGLTVVKSTDSSLVNGDVITQVNGVPVHSIADWNEAVKDTYNGSSLKITYIRNNVTGFADIKG